MYVSSDHYALFFQTEAEFGAPVAGVVQNWEREFRSATKLSTRIINLCSATTIGNQIGQALAHIRCEGYDFVCYTIACTNKNRKDHLHVICRLPKNDAELATFTVKP